MLISVQHYPAASIKSSCISLSTLSCRSCFTHIGHEVLLNKSKNCHGPWNAWNGISFFPIEFIPDMSSHVLMYGLRGYCHFEVIYDHVEKTFQHDTYRGKKLFVNVLLLLTSDEFGASWILIRTPCCSAASLATATKFSITVVLVRTSSGISCSILTLLAQKTTTKQLYYYYYYCVNCFYCSMKQVFWNVWVTTVLFSYT